MAESIDEAERLRDLSVNALAAEMGRVSQKTLGWGRYEAEFQRRQFVTQRFSAIVAVGSVVVSAIAIVVGAISSVRTDQVVSEAAMARIAEPCILPVLPDSPTNADLDIAYMERGVALVECDIARRSAYDLLRGENSAD